MEKRLGDFEEVLMLIVGIVNEENSYAYRITVEFKAQTGRSLSIGAAHSTLDRLENKGFLKSQIREGTGDRGERSKRIYRLTALGETFAARVDGIQNKPLASIPGDRVVTQYRLKVVSLKDPILPRGIQAILRTFLRTDLVDEFTGDMHEMYKRHSPQSFAIYFEHHHMVPGHQLPTSICN
ncbi:MAG: helix-turn-helix transcriptional regulator [Bacteroidota bacterium]